MPRLGVQAHANKLIKPWLEKELREWLQDSPKTPGSRLLFLRRQVYEDEKAECEKRSTVLIGTDGLFDIRIRFHEHCGTSQLPSSHYVLFLRTLVNVISYSFSYCLEMRRFVLVVYGSLEFVVRCCRPFNEKLMKDVNEIVLVKQCRELAVTVRARDTYSTGSNSDNLSGGQNASSNSGEVYNSHLTFDHKADCSEYDNSNYCADSSNCDHQSSYEESPICDSSEIAADFVCADSTTFPLDSQLVSDQYISTANWIIPGSDSETSYVIQDIIPSSDIEVSFNHSSSAFSSALGTSLNNSSLIPGSDSDIGQLPSIGLLSETSIITPQECGYF